MLDQNHIIAKKTCEGGGMTESPLRDLTGALDGPTMQVRSDYGAHFGKRM